MARWGWAALAGGILVAAVAGVSVGLLLSGGDSRSPSKAEIAAAVRAALATTSTTVTPTTATTTTTIPVTTTTARVVPQPTLPPPPLSFGPGVYEVGVDMPAGMYRTTDEGCFWAKLRSSNTGDVSEFNYGAGPVTVDSPWFNIEVNPNNPNFHQCVFRKVG